MSKPGTAQTITAPADMALNSTVAKEATLNSAVTTIDGHTDSALAALAPTVIVSPSGAHNYTSTIRSSLSVALVNATVQLISGGTVQYSGYSGVSGAVSMQCNSGTYTRRVTLAGYTFADATITVGSSDYAEGTVTGTAVTVTPPPSSSFQTLWDCEIQNGAAVTGAIVEATTTAKNKYIGTSGYLNHDPDSTTTDANGRWELTLARGVEYRVIVRTGAVIHVDRTITITTDSTKQLLSYTG
jgi:hypothetical protein